MQIITNNKKKISFMQFTAVFSYFIYLNDESYRYNIPYLIEQYKKFKMFLHKAHEKWTVLNNVAERLKNAKEILGVLNGNKKLTISINDFLEFECSKRSIRNNIKFYGEPSINRAKWDKKDSVFTVKYYDNDGLKRLKTYQYQNFNGTDKEIEENFNALITIVRNMLGMGGNG